MVWTDLVAHAASLEPAMLNLAFVFLLLGYGTKVGLFPLHAWLPDAHAEGPTPISAVLSGLLLNVALYALLRFKMLLAGNPEALAPGPLMIAMGLVSLLFGAFMLYRRRDIKRLFAYSSIEHMGLITFAFGIGGPLANFAGLLHMTLHSLTKSAIFFAVGDISQVKGTQKIADMGGLTKTNPVLGWGLVIGVVAIAGLPPLGIFTSEFLIVSSTFARQPLLALPLVLGLLDRRRRAVPAAEPHRLRRAEGTEPQGEMLLCADVRCISASCSSRASICRGRSSPGSRPWRSCSDRRGHGGTERHCQDRPQSGKPPPVAARRGRAATAGSVRSSIWSRRGATLLGLWGDKDAVHLALLEEPSATSPCSPSNVPTASSPRSARIIRRRSGSSAPSPTSTA